MKKDLGIYFQKKYNCKIMLAILLLFITVNVKANDNRFEKPDTASIEGRWDIIMTMSGKEFPSWLEVSHSGNNRLIGQYVGVGGSARPISKINFTGVKMSFTIPPQWEKEDDDLLFEATLQNDNLIGTVRAANGKSYSWTATHSPALKRKSEPVWGKSITLFNGKNLKGWHALGDNQWKAEGGILRSPKSGSNLVTDDVFNDFKLHVEFRYPKGSNSGVYLRGRYEVQIEDSKGRDPSKHQLGAVYGFIAPTDMMAKEAGEWQSYDITLLGRMVSVVANGKTIICNQEIPGITGGAINSKEGDAGPIMFQGDHGPIDFRKIILTPAK